jgi:hypothetical protein
MKPSVIAWIRSAAHPGTVRRALMTAVIVGFVLIGVNHGPAIISGQVTRARIIQMCLTLIVPYVVSTVSSVATRNEGRSIRSESNSGG